MLTAETIAKIRRIELRAGHFVTEALAGQYASAFKGQGMEFSEVREYVHGDDVRLIDWNVTARAQTPHVKLFREERELTLMLVVDVSASQNFGSRSRSKADLAAEVAAMLAYLAIRNQDKVGLIIFSDHVELFVPPKKGKAHVWQIIRTVLTHRGQGKQTNVAGALEFMLDTLNRKGLCFLVSDFCLPQEAYFENLKRTKRRHEMVCVHLTDPSETRKLNLGVAQWLDAETGEFVVANTEALDPFAPMVGHNLKSQCARANVGYLHLDTAQDIVPPFVKFFQGRQGRS